MIQCIFLSVCCCINGLSYFVSETYVLVLFSFSLFALMILLALELRHIIPSQLTSPILLCLQFHLNLPVNYVEPSQRLCFA